jgi:hypothetical protein
MTQILDRVAHYFSYFTPSKITEYLALQVARKLSDTTAFRHYLVLFEHYPEHLLLDIFRRCQSDDTLTGEHFMRLLREQTR